MTASIRVFLVASVFLFGTNIDAQTVADRSLLAEISKIKAIDNHAHPLKYVAPGEKADDEYDALPLEAIPPFPFSENKLDSTPLGTTETLSSGMEPRFRSRVRIRSVTVKMWSAIAGSRRSKVAPNHCFTLRGRPIR